MTYKELKAKCDALADRSDALADRMTRLIVSTDVTIPENAKMVNTLMKMVKAIKGMSESGASLGQSLAQCSNYTEDQN